MEPGSVGTPHDYFKSLHQRRAASRDNRAWSWHVVLPAPLPPTPFLPSHTSSMAGHYRIALFLQTDPLFTALDIRHSKRQKDFASFNKYQKNCFIVKICTHIEKIQSPPVAAPPQDSAGEQCSPLRSQISARLLGAGRRQPGCTSKFWLAASQEEEMWAPNCCCPIPPPPLQ